MGKAGDHGLKPVFWMASSLDDLRSFSEEVCDAMGFALFQAQMGGKHIAAKPMKGYKGAGVLEVVEDWDGETFRVVYTVKFKEAIYVLHAFQKKSKTGIKTPKRDIDLVDARLALAKAHHERWTATHEKPRKQK
ncbi:MAG: type II toxin-antitoxin system RelE/ParE family toxin [Planctomycetota bacterium]|nr:type II toxin-antitoxin system RelE/ParE family toxin [Planctomycetota bacterium]